MTTCACQENYGLHFAVLKISVKNITKLFQGDTEEVAVVVLSLADLGNRRIKASFREFLEYKSSALGR